jgi:hypothetical protein
MALWQRHHLHDYAGALDLLRRAHELMPDNARYAYVYAVALNSSGKAERRWRCWRRRATSIRWIDGS